MNIDCNILVVEVEKGMKSHEHWELPSDKPLGLEGTFVFSYDYPLSITAYFRHDLTRDMTGMDLLVLGRADYERIYKEEDEDVGGPTPMIAGMLNRQRSNGTYGIWGHVIDDLFFEAIHVSDKQHTIRFGMGS